MWIFLVEEFANSYVNLTTLEIVAICIIENCIYVLIWKNPKYLCINKYFDFQENYEFESLFELLKFIVELIFKSKYLYIINILGVLEIVFV